MEQRSLRWRAPGQRTRLALIGLGVGVLAMIGAYLGVHLPAWLNGDLEATRDALAVSQADLVAANARISTLQEERIAQRDTIDDLTAQLGEQERDLGNLQAALGLSGPLTEQYSQMTDELSTLKADHTNLQAEYDNLLASMEPLVPIRTP
ncbi:MAG: hypothetical protein M0R75_06800, partial [Dehalococcoidia bacterium]|nr:hypothetical protein [Dehalococcoidia bacterium]